MNVRNYAQCDVCNTVTLLKYQIGYLSSYPISYKCGKCGVTIFGEITLNQEEADHNLTLQNATLIYKEKEIGFIVQISGEFLAKKITKCTPENYESALFSPFITESANMWGEIENFKERNNDFLYLINNEWGKVKRIYELYSNSNRQFFIKEVRKILNNQTDTPLEKQSHFIKAINKILFLMFSPITTSNGHHKLLTDILSKEIRAIFIKDKEKLRDFLNVNISYFASYESKILDLFERFTKIYNFIIPIFSLNFREELTDADLVQLGLTTTSFEDIKHFYIDCYETIIESSHILIGLDNLKVRNDYRRMRDLKDFPKIKTIDDYSKIRNKGNKIKVLSSEETFANLIIKPLDNDIRNSIGHNSYKVEKDSQLISFYSNKGNIDKELYLVEFAQYCFEMFFSLYNTMHTILDLKEIYYLFLEKESPNQDNSQRKKQKTKKRKNKSNMRKKSKKVNRK
ncbi:hypothetical protein [Halobacillus aidingensis]|uniref:SEC-C motif-containing protein n=1 Tax=Halobacillus aidingensis TaxID=240303 RepID=A0A1H0S8Q4_HALAD|nr:hypothetical protein [Halobacillus aidingensis]SDP38047.1 hypothetical protein SAMN05421677_11765 [Halobacillus aidingensis]